MIHISKEIPDSTYFRTGDAEPTMNADGSLTIYDGQGSSRSWGRPQVASTVVLDSADLIAVHVGFSHKHGGSQFWRYYRRVAVDALECVAWRSLSDDERQAVLDAVSAGYAPSWAKSPGKLRSARKKVDGPFTGYKIVRVTPDGTLASLFDPRIKYTIGDTMIERAAPYHGGGYYSYTTCDGIGRAFRDGSLQGKPGVGRYAILECTCWGRRIYYDISGKVADGPTLKVCSTYLRPEREIGHFRIE
jgi:hypothetical protein